VIKVKLRGKQRANGAAGDPSDTDGQTERSICAGADESISKQATEISQHGRRVRITTWEECSRVESVGS
jgi:hypothetical protein